jgi:hypothetical protein
MDAGDTARTPYSRHLPSTPLRRSFLSLKDEQAIFDCPLRRDASVGMDGFKPAL